MLCEKCNENPATYHIVKVINGNKTEINLCENCAKEHEGMSFGGEFDMAAPFSFQNLLSGLMDYINQSSQSAPVTDVSCNNCGLSYSEFKQKGLLGCSECYKTFGNMISPVVKRVQGNTEHIGKVPSKANKDMIEKKRILKLKEELQNAILAEEYEKAAIIRDEIKSLQKSE